MFKKLKLAMKAKKQLEAEINLANEYNDSYRARIYELQQERHHLMLENQTLREQLKIDKTFKNKPKNEQQEQDPIKTPAEPKTLGNEPEFKG